MNTKQFNHVLATAGDGLWSGVAKSVKVILIEVPYINNERTFGELRVYFDTDTWNIQQDGLIYTDSRFLDELRGALADLGLTGTVDYSEQGMQGEDYVSLDVGENFIQSWVDSSDTCAIM
jgi:hypothetical protein